MKVNIDKLKQAFEGREITIGGLSIDLKRDFGVEFFENEFYEDAKLNGVATVGHYRDEIEFFKVEAKVIEDTGHYYDTKIKILIIA